MNLKDILKLLFKKKYIIYGIIIILFLSIVWILFFKNNNNKVPFVAHSGDFLSQISVSGKITAVDNVNLSFEQAGIISGVYVKVGDRVNKGKLIATQDTSQLYAQSLQMQAGIELQQAKLNQLLAGSSPEDIKIKEDAVVAAHQDLKNSYDNSLVTLSNSYNTIYNAYTLATSIQNTYFSVADQGGIKVQDARLGISNILADVKTYIDTAKVNSDSIDLAITNTVVGLNNTYNYLKIIRDQCEEGVYYFRVSSTDKTLLDTQRTNINTVLTSLLSSKQNIISYKTSLQQAQNQLQVIKATPRITDIAVYNAQIKQAEASLQEIYSQIRKKQIIASISGTITEVNAKVGSIMSLTEIAVSIISDGKFQIESYVPEIYISSIKIGNQAEITLDAYSPDKKFGASVVFIDPSETIKDGVSTYKTKLQFLNDDTNMKDGMSANIVIIISKKENVISVPQGLIIVKDDKKFVKLMQDKNIIEKEVQTGEVSSSGQVEIISGLNEGDILPL